MVTGLNTEPWLKVVIKNGRETETGNVGPIHLQQKSGIERILNQAHLWSLYNKCAYKDLFMCQDLVHKLISKPRGSKFHYLV